MKRTRYRNKATAVTSLPEDILANIHGRLCLLDRLAFAAVFRASRDAFKPEAPCLILPGDAPQTVTLFSLAERLATAVHAPGPNHAVLGSSSRGWLITADDRARLCIINPVTSERRVLPAIDTIPCIDVGYGRRHFTFYVMCFLRGAPPYPYGTMTLRAEQMCRSLYRKVVLSDSSDVAMLITGPQYGVTAFAMVGDGSWRLEFPHNNVERVPTVQDGSSRLRHFLNGVEDAVHHKGRFYSITYSGKVEVWEERAADAPGVFASAAIAPKLLLPSDSNHHKYLVASPDGRLMVVLKETTGRRKSPSFKVQVLDAGREGWKETDDIGDTALFVGVSGSLCISTREHSELKAGCVYYYTKDDPGPCEDARDDDNGIRVFSLKDHRAEKVECLGRHRSWTPPAWFIPSIPR